MGDHSSIDRPDEDHLKNTLLYALHLQPEILPQHAQTSIEMLTTSLQKLFGGTVTQRLQDISMMGSHRELLLGIHNSLSQLSDAAILQVARDRNGDDLTAFYIVTCRNNLQKWLVEIDS